MKTINPWRLMIATLFLLPLLLFVFPAESWAQTNQDQTLLRQVQEKVSEANIPSQVMVRIKDKVVYIDGTVESKTEAENLVQAIQSVEDVRDVNTDSLHVKGSDSPLADAYTTAKIKGLFLREKLMGNGNIAVTQITVETRNGTVYLGGEADNPQQVENAVRLAKSVAGVTAVQTTVKVKNSN